MGLSNDDVRLYITQGKKADFVALSHGSGGGTPLKTTTTSLPSRLSAISFDQSPKTFRDAVNVTRRLGMRFLWIDSLCILQDSEEDWTREASRISDVYSNTTVTISADSAANCSQGLFQDPVTRTSQSVLFKSTVQTPMELLVQYTGGGDSNYLQTPRAPSIQHLHWKPTISYLGAGFCRNRCYLPVYFILTAKRCLGCVRLIRDANVVPCSTT